MTVTIKDKDENEQQITVCT